jgi:hypothetical protein
VSVDQSAKQSRVRPMAGRLMLCAMGFVVAVSAAGCPWDDAARTAQEGAHEIHPQGDLPKLPPGAGQIVPTLSAAQQKAVNILNGLDDGSLEGKLVKKAACSAMRKTQDDSSDTAGSWQDRIYAELPSTGLEQYVIHKLVARAAAGLGAANDYPVYLRVCGFR